MQFKTALVFLTMTAGSLAAPGLQVRTNPTTTSAETCKATYNGSFQCCNSTSQQQFNILQILSSVLGPILGVVPNQVIPTIIPDLTPQLTCTTVTIIANLAAPSCDGIFVCCVPQNNGQVNQSGGLIGGVNVLPNANLAVCPQVKGTS